VRIEPDVDPGVHPDHQLSGSAQASSPSPAGLAAAEDGTRIQSGCSKQH
jgi:hypothetical protein